jgi:hypothetical protein
LGDLGNAGGTSNGCNPPDATHTCFLDNVLAQAVDVAHAKSGYYFLYTPTPGTAPNTGFSVLGNPATPGTTGSRYFYTDQSGVIRFDPAAQATSSSNPLQ